MITQVKVCNRAGIERLAFTNFGFPKFGNSWHLISIHGDSERLMNPPVVNALKVLGMKEWMSQEFWDITDDSSLIEQLKKSYPNYILFNQDQAMEIVNFINDRQKESGDDMLVCHCDAGISRSGAVGMFACEACGLNYAEFRSMHPFIHPNLMVLKMLRQASGMDRKTDFIAAFERDRRKSQADASKFCAGMFG